MTDPVDLHWTASYESQRQRQRQQHRVGVGSCRSILQDPTLRLLRDYHLILF
jgi:hypothetical protein